MAPPARRYRPPGSRGWRTLRRLLFVFALLLAATWASSPWWLARYTEQVLHARGLGVSIGRAWLDPLDGTLDYRDIGLRSPRGVALVWARLSVRLDFRALLNGVVRVSDLRAGGARIEVSPRFRQRLASEAGTVPLALGTIELNDIRLGIGGVDVGLRRLRLDGVDRLAAGEPTGVQAELTSGAGTATLSGELSLQDGRLAFQGQVKVENAPLAAFAGPLKALGVGTAAAAVDAQGSLSASLVTGSDRYQVTYEGSVDARKLALALAHWRLGGARMHFDGRVSVGHGARATPGFAAAGRLHADGLSVASGKRAQVQAQSLRLDGHASGRVGEFSAQARLRVSRMWIGADRRVRVDGFASELGVDSHAAWPLRARAPSAKSIELQVAKAGARLRLETVSALNVRVGAPGLRVEGVRALKLAGGSADGAAFTLGGVRVAQVDAAPDGELRLSQIRAGLLGARIGSLTVRGERLTQDHFALTAAGVAQFGALHVETLNLDGSDGQWWLNTVQADGFRVLGEGGAAVRNLLAEGVSWSGSGQTLELSALRLQSGAWHATGALGAAALYAGGARWASGDGDFVEAGRTGISDLRRTALGSVSAASASFDSLSLGAGVRTLKGTDVKFGSVALAGGSVSAEGLFAASVRAHEPGVSDTRLEALVAGSVRLADGRFIAARMAANTLTRRWSGSSAQAAFTAVDLEGFSADAKGATATAMHADRLAWSGGGVQVKAGAARLAGVQIGADALQAGSADATTGALALPGGTLRVGATHVTGLQLGAGGAVQAAQLRAAVPVWRTSAAGGAIGAQSLELTGLQAGNGSSTVQIATLGLEQPELRGPAAGIGPALTAAGFQAKGVEFDSGAASIQQAGVDALHLRFGRDAAGAWQWPVAGAGAWPLPAIGSLALAGAGDVEFVDRRSAPPVDLDIRNLGGKLDAFGVAGVPHPGKLRLDGVLGGAGVTLRGNLEPTAGGGMDFALHLRLAGVPVRDLAAYAHGTLGLSPTAGRLSGHLDLRLHADQLKGQGRLLLDHLRYATPSKTLADGLPLGEALSLLEGAGERTELEFSFAGDVTDPRFSLADVVRDALTGSVRESISSVLDPLGLTVAGKGGGGAPGAHLAAVLFGAGSADLGTAQREYLDRVAAALRAHPGLRLAPCPFATRSDEQSLRLAALVAQSPSAPPPGRRRLREQSLHLARERAAAIAHYLAGKGVQTGAQLATCRARWGGHALGPRVDMVLAPARPARP